MSIEIKFTFGNFEQAQLFMNSLDHKTPPPEVKTPTPEELEKAASNKVVAKEGLTSKGKGDNSQGVKALLDVVPADPPVVTYPMLQKAVFALAAKDRNAALAVAVQFGVSNFKELPEARWAEALTLVQAKVDAL